MVVGYVADRGDSTNLQEHVRADAAGLTIQSAKGQRRYAWSQVRGVQKIEGYRQIQGVEVETTLWRIRLAGRSVYLNSDENGARIIRAAENIVRRRWRPVAGRGATDASISLSRMSGQESAERGISVAVGDGEEV